jgi:Fe-S oxidoreductase
MLREANAAVARIMALARSLGGVISGEHGIGITKLEYLTADELAPFAAYKAKVDPHGRFNARKLLPGADLSGAYTPSFSLIGHESLILEASRIGQVAASIKDCLRCGKCKPVCATHVPRANLLYSPRNKILATSLLTEALLYEEQTRRGVSFRHFDEFSDVADHCTVCHKCEKPCPVDIDFGDVSIAMRNLLRDEGKQAVPPGDRRGDGLPERHRPDDDQDRQAGDDRLGLRGAAARAQRRRAPGTHQGADEASAVDDGSDEAQGAGDHFINKPMPGGLPKRTSRALLDIEDATVVPIIRNPADRKRATPCSTFPGCGSERLFSQVGLATQAMLWHVGRADGAAAGLPLLRLSANGGRRGGSRQRIITDNRVLFHPRREHAQLPRHQDGDRVVRHLPRPAREVRVRRDLPGLPPARHPRVPARERRRAFGIEGVRYMYHDPCHTPMKQRAPLAVVNGLMG